MKYLPGPLSYKIFSEKFVKPSAKTKYARKIKHEQNIHEQDIIFKL